MNKKQVRVGIGIALLAVILGVLLVREDGFAGVLSTFSEFGAVRLVGAVGIGLLALVFAALRYIIVLRDLGHSVPMRAANWIFAMSAVGGAVFFQFYGQTAVRSSLMRKFKIPPEDVLIISLVERVAGLFVLGALGFTSLLYLKGIDLELTTGGEPVMVLLALLVTGLFVFKLLRPAFQELGLGALSKKLSKAWLRAVGMTLLVHTLTFLSYFLFLSALRVELWQWETVSATLIIMFAAAIPVSFSGWGIRELSAAYAFSLIGLTISQSVAVAVAVGITSLVALLLYWLVSWRSESTRQVEKGEKAETDSGESGRYLVPKGLFALLSGCAVSVALVFSLQVPVGDGFVRVCLGDPIVLLMAVVALLNLSDLMKSGRYRLNRKNLIFLGLGVSVFLFGFVYGWISFGFTEWAFFNRVVGLGVLLCYLLCGVYVAKIGEGLYSAMNSIRSFVVALTVIVAISALFGGLAPYLPGDRFAAPLRMEGFSKNPNAFAFQLCLAAALLSGFFSRYRPGVFLLSMCGVIYLGLYETGSRAGMLVAISILLCLLALRERAVLRENATAIGLGLFFSLPGSVLSWGRGYLVSLAQVLELPFGQSWILRLQQVGSVQAVSVSELADRFRWGNILGGLKMFGENPIIGAGLGAYLHQDASQGGHGVYGVAFVIHSTPVWVLAEFGLVGFSVFVAAIVVLARFSFAERKRIEQSRNADFDSGLSLLMMLVVFLVFGIPHEMAFQRGFWFFVGILAAGLFFQAKFTSGGDRDSEKTN